MFKADKKLKKIINDNYSGSRAILFNLNKYLIANIKLLEDPEFISFLYLKLNSFQTIINYLNTVCRFSKEEEDLIIYLKSIEVQLTHLNIASVNRIKKVFKNLNTVLTFSNSKTLEDVFENIYEYKPDLKIVVAEARPNLEGRILVKNLSKIGFNTALITDAMIPHCIPKCDAAFIGADKILKNKNVINKIGSSTIALACKHSGKPFYVVTDKTKKSKDTKFENKKGDRSEVWECDDKKIYIPNFYFEEISTELITKIIYL